MGSIPVGSTKKAQPQFCGCAFLVFSLANRAMVRQYGVSHILAVGLPLAGNGKFPFYQK